MRVRDLMTPDPVTVSPWTLVTEARHLMDCHGVHYLPVVDGGAVVGVVAQRDVNAFDEELLGSLSLLPGAELPHRYRSVCEVMAVPPQTISAEESVESAVRMLVTRRIRALPVLDGSRLVGILTTTDILHALLANTLVWQGEERSGQPAARPRAFVVHADARARQRHHEELTTRGYSVETCPGPASVGGLCPALQAKAGDISPCLRLPTGDIALVILDPEAASAGLAEVYRHWLPSTVIRISEYGVFDDHP